MSDDFPEIVRHRVRNIGNDAVEEAINIGLGSYKFSFFDEATEVIIDYYKSRLYNIQKDLIVLESYKSTGLEYEELSWDHFCHIENDKLILDTTFETLIKKSLNGAAEIIERNIINEEFNFIDYLKTYEYYNNIQTVDIDKFFNDDRFK